MGSAQTKRRLVCARDPREQWHELTAYVTLWGVLWSSVALDDLIKNNPRRNLLNRTSEKGQADLRLRLK